MPAFKISFMFIPLLQATDRAKNTPLHVIVLYKKIVSDFLTLHAIILALLEAGAHIGQEETYIYFLIYLF